MAPDRDRGFTLVELLVVILILGVLSAIAFPAFAAQSRKGKLAAMKSSLKNAANIEESLATEGGYATPDAAGLAQLVAEGLRLSADVTLTVVDDDMTAVGGGFCLQAHHDSLPAGDDLYFASNGPDSGHPTTTECTAS